MLVKGSSLSKLIWEKSWKIILYHFVIALTISLIDRFSTNISFNLPIGVLSTMGIAISFFLGYIIRATYDRWWEARIVWGGIVNYSRSFAREVITLTDTSDEVKKELIHRHISWLYNLKNHLRKLPVLEEGNEYLPENDITHLQKVSNVPAQLVKIQGEQLKAIYNRNETSNYNLIQLDSTLNEFYNLQGKCERIKNTVFPREFSYLSRFFVIVFTTLVPFHLVDNLEFGLIPITIFEGFLFHILERLSHFYKNPFENGVHDTPMSSLTRNIEIDLLEMINTENIPKPLTPINGVMY